MLEDGTIVDSAKLPPASVASHPVMISQAALYRSIHGDSGSTSPRSSENDPAPFRASRQLVGPLSEMRTSFHPIILSGQPSAASSRDFLSGEALHFKTISVYTFAPQVSILVKVKR